MSQEPATQNLLENFHKYYDSLNPEQKKAVDSIEGPSMTIAGAGTGKTQILAVRIAKILIETQIDPFNILCLTFTDAGVTAMRKRLLEIIGTAAYHVKICTFHSFCNEIIKDNPDTFVFKNEGEQLDDLERLKTMQKVIDKLGVLSKIRPANEPYLFLKDINTHIQNLKKENITPKDFYDKIAKLSTFLNQIESVLRDFLEAKRSFPANLCELANPETLLPQIECLTDKNFSNDQLIASQVLYLKKIYQQYQDSLCGEKRKDNSAGKKLRDNLKRIVSEGIINLEKQTELAKAYDYYQQELSQNGFYDYEDMIMMVTNKLATDPILLRKYQEIYQYILVDEYQDTNNSQNKTVQLLGNYFDAPNIFVVGDDDQAIYRFQGASIDNIVNFYKNYQNEINLITLIRNYRSQQTILDGAGNVVNNNQQRIANFLPNIDKNLISQTSLTPEKIKLFVYETDENENYYTATKIQQLIADGVKASEIAVLYHKHAEALMLTDLLIKFKIPFSLKNGQNILHDIEIGKLLNLFKLIENPNDDDLFNKTLFLDFLKFDPLDVLKFANYFSIKGLKHFQGHSFLTAAKDKNILQAARINAPENFENFVNLLLSWKEKSCNQTLPEFFIEVLNDSKFIDFQIKQKDKNQLEILNKIKSIYKEIKEQTKRNHNLSITEFLEQLKIRQKHDLKLLEDPLEINSNAVQLMTAHGAKGLEFEHVFLINCTSRSWDKPGRYDKIKLPAGLVSSIISDPKQELEEDNRRLFYVAMTRAKKQLYLSYARNQIQNGKTKEDLPSIYVTEISDHLIDKQEIAGDEKTSENYIDLIIEKAPEPDLEKQKIEYFKFLAEDYVLSPTALNNYLTCPRKFFYQNLIRLPQPKHAAAAMGTAVHKALELFIKKYAKTKINPGVEFILLNYKKALQKELLTDQEYSERLKYGENLISEYWEAKNNTLTPDLQSEINFRSHGVNVEGVLINGKIDKVGLDPTNQNGLIVSDFKTGNPERGMRESKHGGDYWRQMVFYKILADNSPKFKRDYPHKQVTVSQLEFLEKNKNGEHPIAAIKADSTAIAEVTENIVFVNQQIKALEFDKIDRSDACDRCPFKNICWDE